MSAYEDVLYEAQDGVAVADDEMQKSFKSGDFKEGVAHYLEKRAPRFTGR